MNCHRRSSSPSRSAFRSRRSSPSIGGNEDASRSIDCRPRVCRPLSGSPQLDIRIAVRDCIVRVCRQSIARGQTRVIASPSLRAVTPWRNSTYLEVRPTVSGRRTLAADALRKYRDNRRRAIDAFGRLKLKGFTIEGNGAVVGTVIPNANRQGVVFNFGQNQAPNQPTNVVVSEVLTMRLAPIDRLKNEEILNLIAKILDTAKDRSDWKSALRRRTTKSRSTPTRSPTSLDSIPRGWKRPGEKPSATQCKSPGKKPKNSPSFTRPAGCPAAVREIVGPSLECPAIPSRCGPR